jgi:hypothetical protein
MLVCPSMDAHIKPCAQALSASRGRGYLLQARKAFMLGFWPNFSSQRSYSTPNRVILVID